MNNDKPIKRSPHLIPLSREHHHALLLSWKIEMGFRKGIEPARMKKYADWFYTHHLLPHFEMEETLVFPALGAEHPLVQQALQEHRRLVDLFTGNAPEADAMNAIGEELEKHIRFEERVLFNEIQAHATPEQLEAIGQHHTEDKFEENREDVFWEWQ